jgi:GT2 family glycosyltransferase
MDRRKLAAIGFFDETFNPFYNEDVELSLRAWRMGWKCYFEPSAHAHHACSSTIKSYSNGDTIRIISLRNRFVLHDIHLESASRLLFFSKLVWDLCTRWLTLDFNYYKAFKDYFFRKSLVRKSRQNFAEMKPKLTLSEVVRILKVEQLKDPCRIFS